MRNFLLAPVAAVLAACAVGPNYHQPDTKVPETFQGTESKLYSNEATVADFWKNFSDPALEKLVDDARRRGTSAASRRRVRSRADDPRHGRLHEDAHRRRADAARRTA